MTRSGDLGALRQPSLVVCLYAASTWSRGETKRDLGA